MEFDPETMKIHICKKCKGLGFGIDLKGNRFTCSECTGTGRILVKTLKEEFTLDSLSEKVVIKKDPQNNTRVTVEYRNANGANIEAYQVVKVNKIENKKEKKTMYGVSYRDLVNSTIRPVSVETSVNHTTKAEYIVGGQGTFALYDAKNKKAIPFIIK